MRERSAQRHYGRIIREQTDHWFRKKYEEHSEYAEKGNIVESSAPHGFLSALGMPGSEVLPDQRGCGVAQSPRGQDKETTMRMATVYPATERQPKMETIRTRPIQLALAMANWSIPVSETRSRRSMTATLRRRWRARTRMRSEPECKR